MCLLHILLNLGDAFIQKDWLGNNLLCGLYFSCKKQISEVVSKGNRNEINNCFGLRPYVVSPQLFVKAVGGIL